MRKILLLVFDVIIAMIGYHIHGSFFWAIMDFIFSPIALIKWLICHEITVTVITETFSWFFN